MGHFYQDKSYYFLTGRTFTGEHDFDAPEKKQILFERFKTARERLEIKVLAYAILSNKHEMGKDFEELESYRFCSYNYMVERKGREFAEDLVQAVIAVDMETKESCERYFAVK